MKFTHLLLSLSLALNLSAGDPMKTIVIDVSHGGKDFGATTDQLSEKELSLALALQLREFAQNSDLELVLLRDKDEYLNLRERAQLVNEIAPDLVISIHFGSNKNGEAAGVNYHLGTDQSALDASNEALSAIAQQLDPMLGKSAQHRSNFYLLNNWEAPAVLIEFGNLNNPMEYAFWANAENQKRVAEAIITAL